nr:hypothetical protein [Tanacetum cinerariifolium]
MASQMVHAADRFEQIGTQVEQRQQTATQRDEVVVGLTQRVQALQAAVQQRDSHIQQLQTTVLKMSSRESTLMQCIIGMDRRLTDLERRPPGPQPYASGSGGALGKQKVEVMASQMVHAADRFEQIGTQVEQRQQTATQRDEVVVGLTQRVQALQAAVQQRDSHIQQLQTTVLKMSSRESTLMQCIIGMDRRLTDLERRPPGPQ